LYRCTDNRTSIGPDHGLILDVVVMEPLNRRFSRRSLGILHQRIERLGVVEIISNAIKPSVAGIPSMASMSPRVDTNRANACPIATTASQGSALPRKCALSGRWAATLAPRNVDVAALRADAEIDHDGRAPCFRDSRLQISKSPLVSAAPTTKMRLILRLAVLCRIDDESDGKAAIGQEPAQASSP
jgi:hypothetical protein